MARCKITVLRKMSNPDFAEEYCIGGASEQLCPLMNEGQEFMSDGRQPEGFCSWAWDDIGKYLAIFDTGANFTDTMKWMKDPNTIIACCTDGIRPVVFKIERL
jgi:uncharacterized repeat protein (TIGR04076 family)